MHKPQRYSLINLAESIRRGGDIKAAKYERGLSGMILDVYETAHGRPGAAIPTVAMQRDLAVGAIDGGGALSAESVLPVAQACRPKTVLEEGGANVITLNQTGAATLPVWDGSVSATSWIAEGGASPDWSSLTVKSISSSPKCCAARVSYSRRLMKSAQDPAGMERSLLAELTRAVRVEIEEKFLSGLGNANEPKGIYTTPGVGSKTFASALPTHAELTDMLHTVLDANAELGNLRFIVHTSDFANLLKQQIESGGGTTTLQYESGTYRINGIQVLTTSAATEGKVALLDMSKVNLVFYGIPHVLADRFSGTNALTGETTLILMNWLDSMLVDPSVCVIGSA